MHPTEPILAPNPDLDTARRILLGYVPPDAAQHTMVQRTLDLIDRNPRDAHRRSCREGHLTASALVLDAAGEHVLLVHHRKLDRWLQPGGHCDGDANLVGVAWREATEETGLPGLSIEPQVIDVDIHPIPERPGEPAHLHYDTRFVVWAPSAAAVCPVATEEVREARWVALDEAATMDLDVSLLRLMTRCSSVRPATGGTSRLTT